MGWFWIFIPEWAIVLAVAGIGLALMVGLIRFRQATGLLVGIVLLLTLGPFIAAVTEALFDALPLWLSVIIVSLAALTLARVALRLVFGETAAGHIVGALATDLIRFGFRTVFIPVRLLCRLLFRRRQLLVLMMVAALTASLSACGKSRAVGQGVSRSISKRLLNQRPNSSRLRDLFNHRRTPAMPLRQPRLVNRYTSAEQAARELREGIGANRHMTPNARPGRPISAMNAERRYGLPSRPEVRETILLPSGTQVRHDRAIAGQPGFGELTAPRALPSSVVKKVTPLH